jgi:hypothetical protein
MGVALAVTATPSFAQTVQPIAPAATLGRAVPADAPVHPVVRGAAPDNGVTPLFTRGLFRTQAQPPAGGTSPMGQPGGGTTTLPQPRPVEGQPNVTEQRGNPVTPQVGSGGSVTNPIPFAPPPSYPNYVIPGSGTMVPGPVIVGPQPCEPTYGAGIPVATIPVSPSRPSIGVGQTVPSPAVRLEDPFLAPYNPLLPRVRSAVSTVLGAPLVNDRLTLGGEYLLWFARAQNAPPLLTTSSPANNGIIGTGDTQVIFGNQSLTRTLHSGARFSAIYRLSDLWALDGNVWFLGRNGSEFTATSDQYPVLARPFFDVNNNRNSAQLIAAPGLSTGAANIKSDTNLWGAEANLRRGLFCWPCSRIDLLVGFRNFNLEESLQLTETFARTPNSNTGIGVPTALSGTVIDRFRTENHFYGVNVGLAGELRRNWWFVQGRASVGLGNMYQQATINGAQTINTTTGVQTSEGGLLALPGANIGSFSQTKFGVIPDVGLTFGLNLTQNLRFGVGYNFMYANSVVRPANQIDPGLDVRRIPNFPVTPTPPAISGVRPSAFPLKTSDFFVQGVTFSLFWTW